MSNMLGGGAGQPVATQATRYNGMQVQASQYGMGLTIVYGQQRIAGTLIWYGDFQSIEHRQSVGKGGGGVSTSYTYSSSFQLALCEGPIAGIPTIWKDSGTTSFSDINGTYSLGTQNQAAWSHLSGSDALQYPYTAWVGCLNLALGSSPNVPNFNFEIAGLLQYDPTGSPAIIDADPSAIFSDLLTSTTHGLNFSAFLGALTLYHDYCVANSIFLSLVVDQQTTMNEILTRLLQVTNSNTAWSNGKLIVIPYGDETVTGNGVTYTPPTTVQKYFTDSDYIKPVRVDQKPLSDLYNVVRVEYVNRANNYNTSVAEAKDQADIDNTFGIRQQEMIQGHAITNPTLAQWVAQILLQRALYIRNTYTFTTTMENVAFEPGDVIALSDSLAGLVNEPVRIKSISEQGTNELQFVCEEFPAGVASGATQSVEAPAGYVPSVNGAPDATQPPVIFRAPQFLTDGTPEVWIGVGGAGPNWGGANVLVSLDNVSYSKIGTVSPGCRYGTLTAALATSSTDPDTTNSFSVALDAGGTLSGGTDAEADALSTLMLVDGELVAYASTTLNADGTYTLGNGYLRRGCYQTAIAAHAIGAPWIRVDDSVFRWQVDPSLVGTTVYIKMQPWNLYGGGLVSESSLTPTAYVIGTAEEIPDTPPVPTGLVATGVANGIHLSWSVPNPAAVSITSIERSTDNATWSVVGQVQGTHYTNAFAGPATYYYRIRSRSPAFIWSAYATSVSATGGSADNVGAGASYALPTLNTGGGENVVQNGNFTLGLTGWSKTSDASTMTLVSHALPGGQTGNALQLGNALEYEGVYANPFDFVPGATYLFSVWVSSSVAASYQLRFNKNGYLSNGTIAANTWTLVQGTYTVPTTAVGASAIGQFGFTGETASAQNYLLWGASVVKVRNADTEVSDGNTYGRMPAPPAVSAASTTSLTQSGTTTTIDVGAGTYYLGGVTVNVNSGSVNPGAYGTYYVYFDDPGYAGGAVTYQASTSILDTTKALGRFYVGVITTASGGGGSGGGGFGPCFSGDTRVLTVQGWRRFDELPAEFEILNRAGRYRATLLVHPDSLTPMRRMGANLVTEEHRIRVGNKWLAAKELFYEVAPVQRRTVYNMEVHTDVWDDKHYLLENGLTAHNPKP